MINIENLTKKFGEVTAVDGLTFSVDEGEVLVFLVQMVQARRPQSECFVVSSQRPAARPE